MSTHTYFQVEQLRAKNRARVMESILAFIAGLFMTALLPSLLAQYLFTTEQLMQGTPALLTYIPVISFLIPVAYLLFTMVGNFRREKQAQKLESQLVFGCDCDDCGCDDEMVSEEELKEIEAIVEEALKERTDTKASSKKVVAASKKAKPAKKSKTKKSDKKK